VISILSCLTAFLFLGTWVHNLDPVLLPVWGPLQLRWYGLAYLAGFVAAYVLLKRFARKGLWVLKEEEVPDFIAYGAMFGVFLGGRLGYVLFYMIPDRGIGSVLDDPGVIFRVWDGGMASHGGFLGLMIFTLIFAWRKKRSWPGVGDGLVVVCPLGLLFGRVANFINGELYGRLATSVPWAVKFPASLADAATKDPERFEKAMGAVVAEDPEQFGGWAQGYFRARDAGDFEQARSLAGGFTQHVEVVARDNAAVSEAMRPYLEPLHPSQLYEALLEGAVLFGVLYFLRVRFPNLAHGVLTGLFFILYAVFRIVVEGYREPDAAWVVEGVLTKGQFYSLFMIVIGVGFLIYARGRGRQAAVDAAKAR
jgi:phosphatidylglycerol---prolipoprotein diacylglyceryl transferase